MKINVFKSVSVCSLLLMMSSCSFNESSDDMTEEEMLEYQSEIDEAAQSNGTESLLDDSKKTTDSLMKAIGGRAFLKYPEDEIKMNSEIEDQKISYDYIKSMPDDDYKIKAQNAFPNDFVKQKDEYNKHF